MQILVVEDNLINQKVLVKTLSKIGYHCDVANNRLEGFNLYKTNNYKVVLTDLQMPVMDGYQATRLIRQFENEQKRPPSTIISISGNSREEHQTRAFQSGINVCVTKPFNSEELKKLIQASSVRS